MTVLRDNHYCMRRELLEQALPGVPVEGVLKSLGAAGVVVAAEEDTVVLVPDHVVERAKLMTAERSERHLKLLLLDVAARGGAGVTKKQLKWSRLAANLIEDGLKRLAEEKLIKAIKRPHEKELVYLPFWISLAAQAAGEVWYSTERKGYHRELVDVLLGLLCQSCTISSEVVELDLLMRDFLPKAQKVYAAMMKDEPPPLQELTPTHVEGLLSLLVSEESLLQLSDGYCLLERGKTRIDFSKKLISPDRKIQQQAKLESVKASGAFVIPCCKCLYRVSVNCGNDKCEALETWIQEQRKL